MSSPKAVRVRPRPATVQTLMPVNGSVLPEPEPEAAVATVVAAESVLEGVVVVAAAVPVGAGVVVAGVVVAGVVDGDVPCDWVDVCELVLVDPNGSVYCWFPAEPPPCAKAAVAPPKEKSASSPRYTNTWRDRIAASMPSAGAVRGSAWPPLGLQIARKSWFCRIYCTDRIASRYCDEPC